MINVVYLLFTRDTWINAMHITSFVIHSCLLLHEPHTYTLYITQTQIFLIKCENPKWSYTINGRGWEKTFNEMNYIQGDSFHAPNIARISTKPTTNNFIWMQLFWITRYSIFIDSIFRWKGPKYKRTVQFDCKSHWTSI